MRILVTGGLGFIGSHIVDAYVSLDHEVAVLDNLATGKRENGNAKSALFIGDICNKGYLEWVFREFKPQVVSHHAALCRIREAGNAAYDYFATNVLGTINIIEACKVVGVSRLIFASSGGAIYGQGPIGRIKEYEPCVPIDIYGLTKLQGEQVLSLLCRNTGISWLSLRYSNVYGPRQRTDGEAGAVVKFIHNVMTGSSPEINGDGLSVRDFVYISDVVSANASALSSEAQNLPINIGTGIGTNIRGLLDLVLSQTRPVGHYTTMPTIAEEVRHNVLDIGRAREFLNWSPTISLTDGIKKTYKSMEAVSK